MNTNGAMTRKRKRVGEVGFLAFILSMTTQRGCLGFCGLKISSCSIFAALETMRLTSSILASCLLSVASILSLNSSSIRLAHSS